MVGMDVRTFAGICLKAAKGQEVHSLLQLQLTAGLSNDQLLEQAQAHRVVALLARALRELGIGESPTQTPAFYASRHLLLRSQMKQLDEALYAHGAKVTLLKGSVQLFRPLYPHPGMRDMADIDLLIEATAALDAFSELGYKPRIDEDAMPTSLHLEPGEHHLAPLWRERDLVTVEPHVLPASREFAHLLGNIVSRAKLAEGTRALLLPDPVDQLLLALVHALFHDRASMHGGLFIRALVECELLFAALSPAQQQEGKDLLAARGGARLWQTWREFAGWCFHGDEPTHKRSWRGRLLISEFKLRANGGAGTMSAALANLSAELLKPRFWRSGRFSYFRRKLFDKAFWRRFYSKLSSVPKG